MATKLSAKSILEERHTPINPGLIARLELLNKASTEPLTTLLLSTIGVVELNTISVTPVFHFAGSNINYWSRTLRGVDSDVKPWWEHSPSTDGIGLYCVETSPAIKEQWGIDNIGYVWGSLPTN